MSESEGKKRISLLVKISIGFILGIIFGFVIGPVVPNSPALSNRSGRQNIFKTLNDDHSSVSICFSGSRSCFSR